MKQEVINLLKDNEVSLRFNNGIYFVKIKGQEVVPFYSESKLCNYLRELAKQFYVGKQKDEDIDHIEIGELVALIT